MSTHPAAGPVNNEVLGAGDVARRPVGPAGCSRRQAGLAADLWPVRLQLGPYPLSYGAPGERLDTHRHRSGSGYYLSVMVMCSFALCW
jgi:hypothetical protein